MTSDETHDDGLTHKVLDEIHKIFHMKGITPPTRITLETNIALDCGFDSVDMLELTALLDHEFEIHLLQEEMIKAHHLGEIVQLVHDALKAHSFSAFKAHTIEDSPLTDSERQEIEAYWETLINRKGLAKYGSSALASVAEKLIHSYWKLEVNGKENLPQTGSFLFCANHVSHLDNLALIFSGGRPFHQYVFMSAKDYFFGKAYKTKLLTSLLNVVPFDRSGSYASFRANFAYLDKAKRANQVIVLFPEGTRSMSGKINPFKPGVALFADYLNIEVVPAYIEGTYALFPKGKSFPKPGPINVTIGKPLRLENPYKDPEDPQRYEVYHAFTNKLKQEILKLKPKR